jgi:hypothetical protein
LVFYGAFVWARRALNSEKRRFPARAVGSQVNSIYSRSGRPKREIKSLPDAQAVSDGSSKRPLGNKGEQPPSKHARREAWG